jgi:glycosyltransferase involved in cell wall biosynthesis
MDAKYDKINFLYRTPDSIYASYMYYEGFRKALERNNLLHYAYDMNGKEPLNTDELLKFPILCVNGSWEPLFNIAKSISGKQFIAEINSEALFPVKEEGPQSLSFFDKARVDRMHYLQIIKLYFSRIFKLVCQKNFSQLVFLFGRFLSRGGGFKENDYFRVLEERAGYFNIFFCTVEEDVKKYFGKPCYWFPAWANIEVFDDIAPPVSDKLGFIGSIRGRRIDFFSQDKNKIIELSNTSLRNNILENAKELCKLINKYRFLLCPMSVKASTIPGKIFEYMACKRICFCYLDEKTMFKSGKIFEDGKEIVYFKTFGELEKKYKYYLENQEESDEIAKAGYEKVRKYFNADASAKRFAKIVLHHANGGKYEASFDEVSELIKN